MVRVFPKDLYVCTIRKTRCDKPLTKSPSKEREYLNLFLNSEKFVVDNFSFEAKKHVLIVDDEPAVRRTVRVVLESAGYECSESENGAEAVNWLNEHHADIIIADYQMPVMSGLQLLEHVTTTLNGKTPKVIMLSGVIQDAEKQKAVELGAFTVIDKPCNFRELVVKVNEANDL